MDKAVSNPLKLRRSGRQREASKCPDDHSPQQQVNFVLPAREPKRGEVHICCLPPEVLTRVFRWLLVPDLGQVACVCAGWRDLVYQKSLWRDVTVALNRSMKYIAMGLSELKNLNLSYCYGIGDLGLGYLSGIGLDHPMAKLPQLQVLNLCFSQNYTDLAIRHLSAGQSSIQDLPLSGGRNFSDAIFQWLATMRELRNLNITSTNLTGSGLVKLANAHSLITDLELRHCKYLTDQALEHVGQLNQLCTLGLECTNISDAGLEQLVSGGGDSPIKTLRLWHCDKITDEGMRHVAQLRQLHKLGFQVGDTGLAHLADGQSPVAIVKCLSNVSYVGLKHVARLPNLQSLDLSSCKCITGDSLKEFVAKVSGPLTDLRLWGGCFSCLSDELDLLECVARGLPNLTQLQLLSYGVSWKEIMAAARLLPRLQSLFLDGINVIGEVRSKFDGYVFQ